MLAQVVINIHLSNHNTRFHLVCGCHICGTTSYSYASLFSIISRYIANWVYMSWTRTTDGPHQKTQAQLHTALMKEWYTNPQNLLRNWLVRYIEDIKNDVGFAFNHPIPHGLMSYLRYWCLFAHSRVQHLLCCVFGLFVFVLCTLWYQFLWTVDFWLPLCGIL